MIVLPIVYFVAVFGFFEAVLFKNRIDYWHRPTTIALYFLTATIGALLLITPDPLWLLAETHLLELVALLVLAIVLTALVYRGYFGYNKGDGGSFTYVVAKSCDILFQDTLAVMVALGLGAWLGVSTGILVFALYFVSIHALLLLLIPARYGIIFAAGSLVAGVVFGAIILLDLGIVYVFVLHWLFYAVTYPHIQRLRTTYYRRGE